MEWRLGFRFYVFTYLSTQPTTSGGDIFRCTFLPAALLFQCPSGTPSFVARRKIGEKGVSRGCGPLNPRSNVLGHSDVLCANHLATVRLTRLSRLRRSAYPLASACCGAQEDRETYGTTRLPTINQVGYSLSATDLTAVGAVSMSPWKQCACHTPRTGLNRVNCTRAHT